MENHHQKNHKILKSENQQDNKPSEVSEPHILIKMGQLQSEAATPNSSSVFIPNYDQDIY